MEPLLRYADRCLWPESEPSAAWRRWLLTAGRYLYALARELASGELSLRAMSLVYTTMLSIVPVLGFAFALAKGLGFHEDLADPLRTALAPLEEDGERIADDILGFAEAIDGTVLGVLSVGLFLLTVLSMARKIEGSFNFVWRVDRPRSFARRFTEYVSVILIGPLVIASVLALIGLTSDAVSGLLPSAESQRPLAALVGELAAVIGQLLPFLLTVGVFTFFYAVIPNTRVRLRPALFGSLAAGVTWATGGYLFTTLVVASAKWQSIYSGFAIVLLAMLWLYLSWLIVLLGSQLAYYIQNPFRLRFGERTDPIDNDARERLSLAVMYLVASDFVRPSHGWTRESLASTLRVPRAALEPILDALADAGLTDSTTSERLIPGRDPHHIRLAEIVSSVRGSGRDWQVSRESWNLEVDRIGDRIDSVIDAELGARTLGQLVDDMPAAADA